MGTSFTPATVSSGVQSQTTLNTNFTNIQTALSRLLNVYGDDDTGTNAMQVDLDLNDNDILNGGNAAFDTMTLGGVAVLAGSTLTSVDVGLPEIAVSPPANGTYLIFNSVANAWVASSLDLSSISIDDDTATAFEVKEGSNTYFKITTTDGSEVIQIGNETTNPDVLLSIGGKLDIGNYGSESGGINYDGTTVSTGLRVNDIGGSNFAQMVIHRHSDTLPAVLMGTRSDGNTSTHVALSTGNDPIFSIYGVGWTGSHYDAFGAIQFETAATGTVSSSSSPGDIVFYVVEDGSDSLTETMRIADDGRISTNHVGSPPSRTLQLFQRSGTASLSISSKTAAATSALYIGVDTGGNRSALLSFHSDTTYTGNGSFSILRDTTANGGTSMFARGTGLFKIAAAEGTMEFYAASGIRTTSVAGGAKGLNTFNCEGLYVSGVELSPYFRGRVQGGGTAITLPSGWSSASGSTGVITVTHNLGSANYTLLFTGTNGSGNVIATENTKGANSFVVHTTDDGGSLVDVDINFILIQD